MSCNIEELCLDGTAIDQLPPLLGKLSRLFILNLKNCVMLESLPRNVSECSNIGGLLDNIENSGTLNVLKAERVSGLEVLSSILNLRFLKDLNLTNCSLMELSIILGQLSSLESLYLGKNHFESIPTSIGDLSKLCYLDLSYCKRLQSLPELPPQLEILNAHSCISLDASSNLSMLFSRDNSHSVGVNFSNCFKLLDQTAFKQIVEGALQKIDSLSMRSFPRSAYICFPGNEIPDWFNIQSTGSSVSFKRRSYHPCDALGDLILCAIVAFQNYRSDNQRLVIGFDYTISGRVLPSHGNMRGWILGPGFGNLDSDHVFLGSDSLLKYNYFGKGRYFEEMTVQFYVDNLKTKSRDCCCCKVTKCGVWGPQLQFVDLFDRDWEFM